MNLRTLNNEELLRHARAGIDPLTSTPLELELLDRLESLLDQQSAHKPIADLLDEYVQDIEPGFLRETLNTLYDHDIAPAALAQLCDAMIIDPANTVALLNALVAAGLDDPEHLKAELDLAEQFRALANDARDVFSRLSALTTIANKE